MGVIAIVVGRARLIGVVVAVVDVVVVAILDVATVSRTNCHGRLRNNFSRRVEW